MKTSAPAQVPALPAAHTHAATPYSVMNSTYANDTQLKIVAAPGDSFYAMVGGINRAEDAAFIVRACNAHDGMVAALETAKACLKANRGPYMHEFQQIQNALALARL